MKRIENGNWWSNSSNSTASTYALTTQEFFVEPQNRWYLDRGRGFAIRCVTREGQRKPHRTLISELSNQETQRKFLEVLALLTYECQLCYTEDRNSKLRKYKNNKV